MLENPPPTLLARIPPRRAALILLVAIAMTRADDKLYDTITLKAWRDERRAAKEVRRRRDLETPLYVGH